mmetsp:Transcript_95703/g.219334  ORF Transcript_95703/g.219334 Transcript_95703/m.219334 type:complete len:217 (+) Transcript_95703:1996-2646(+)
MLDSTSLSLPSRHPAQGSGSSSPRSTKRDVCCSSWDKGTKPAFRAASVPFTITKRKKATTLGQIWSATFRVTGTPPLLAILTGVTVLRMSPVAQDTCPSAATVPSVSFHGRVIAARSIAPHPTVEGAHGAAPEQGSHPSLPQVSDHSQTRADPTEEPPSASCISYPSHPKCCRNSCAAVLAINTAAGAPATLITGLRCPRQTLACISACCRRFNAT